MNYSNRKKFIYASALFSISLILVLTAETFAQPSAMWSKSWGGIAARDDAGNACVSDGTGFLYVTGSTRNGSSSNNHDIITIKYNQSTGDTVWTKIFNGSANKDDEASGIALASDGNVIVAGYTDIGSSQTDDQLLVIKYNSSNGAVIWTKTYGSSSGNPPSDENGIGCITDGSNIYVAGTVNDQIMRLKVWKLNSAGDSLYTIQYSGAENTGAAAFSCAVDNSGDLYVAGYAVTGSVMHIALLKYNSAGVFQWIKYSSDVVDPSVQYLMAGCSILGSNIYVTGVAGNSANRYGVSLKYTSMGDTVWVKRNDSPSTYDQNHRCRADANGDLYVAATRYNGTNDDWIILKYKGTDGTLLWTVLYNSNQSDYAIDCALDISGNLYATGMVNFNNNNADIYTVKYQSTIGIKILSENVPTAFSLSQNYPNPFNPDTRIDFNIRSTSDTRIAIYDVLGNKQETLFDGRLNPGTYSIDWNASKYASGIYFCRFTAGDFSQSRKMILTK